VLWEGCGAVHATRAMSPMLVAKTLTTFTTAAVRLSVGFFVARTRQELFATAGATNPGGLTGSFILDINSVEAATANADSAHVAVTVPSQIVADFARSRGRCRRVTSHRDAVRRHTLGPARTPLAEPISVRLVVV
jgi:hypothetical protein